MQARMRLRAPLAMIFGVIMAVAGFAGPANAAPYVNQATISVSSQTPKAGSTIQVCGMGFGKREKVIITLDQNRRGRDSRSAVAFTNRSGEFCTRINVGTKIGAHTLTARGLRSGRTATAMIRVVQAGRRGDKGGKRGVDVLGVSASTGISASTGTAANSGIPEVAGVSATAGTSGLAFTGVNAIGIGALGGLLLVGGAAMVLAGRRRKVNN